MIPQKKKTPEELSTLREELSVTLHTPTAATLPPPPPQAPIAQELPSSSVTSADPIDLIDLPPIVPLPKKLVTKHSRSLRKHELPLAPAPASTNKIELPDIRHDSTDISQVRKHQALAALQQPSYHPVDYFRKQTASPFLYSAGYLLAIVAGITAYNSFHYITPAALLGLSSLIIIYIALRKPCSRHHAALLFIVVFLTLVFGALHYAPLFKDGP
jgi:hypothetical protein